MVHCNPNLEFYQEIKHKILEFLWDNKHAKVAYDQLTADRNKGGIKLVNLTKKYFAQNFMGPRILHSINDWVFVAYQFSLLWDLIFGNVIWTCKMQKA